MYQDVFHPTLYTPATTAPNKLLALVNKETDVAAYRLVLCTEDSIREDEVPAALDTLRTVLQGMYPDSRTSVFVRARTPEVLARVLELPHVTKLSGFVVPKADPESFPDYADQVVGSADFKLMPILESRLMTDRHFRETLRMVFMDPKYHGAIDCLRIGANDLMGHLGIRRDVTQFTVYDTPVGQTINEIINEFRGGLGGFTVSAPVFECYAPAYYGLLRKEVHRHMLNGLFGQTVIHPDHVRIIRDMYKVSKADLESAQAILSKKDAVKGLNGRMDEYTTHWRWAETIIKRYELFGDSSVTKTHADLLN